MSVKQHPKLHRDWIDPFAHSIVQRLQEKGFTAYLVGGCVRDLLAGHKPKDFDIVTSARPEEIKRVISRAYIIGKRFRLVLVKRGDDQFEVATFRTDPPPEESLNEDGLQVRDNVFGTPEEDARRRDFTINSMFYDPVADQVIDYCEGLKDIECRTLRIIGEPKQRLTEDPIRILRALRLAHKLDFTIESSLREAMVEKAPLLKLSVLPRRREEMLKILKLPDPSPTLHEAHDLGILQHAYPTLDKAFSEPDQADDLHSYLSRLHTVNHYGVSEPIFLFGVLLLAFIRARYFHNPHEEISGNDLRKQELIDFMKQELNVFNLEGSLILRAIEMQPSLRDVTEYKKRGHRRKMGFLRNESLPLALVFAELDHALDPEVLMFWKQELKRVESEPEGPRG